MQTVATNLNVGASTQYLNHDFNSMCRFNGATLAAGASGLCKIGTGDNDAGVAIPAYFVPTMTNFGDMRQKRARYAYFGYECSGKLQITLYGDENATIGPYTLAANALKGEQRRRVTLGRGAAFTYAKVKVANVDGSDFAVDLIHVFVDLQKHGVK